MTSVLTKQVSAYRDSVMDASREAVACWDTLKPAQEAILMAPGVVASIRAVLTHAGGEPESRREWVSVCRSMLQSLTSLMAVIKKLREHDFEVAGLPEFRRAVTDVRLMMADLLDADQSTPAPKPETAGAVSVEGFANLAREMPPPQSWYDEDFRGVRGPVAE